MKQKSIISAFLFLIVTSLPFGEGLGGAVLAQQTQWMSLLNGTGKLEYIFDVKQAPDGGYILLGNYADTLYSFQNPSSIENGIGNLLNYPTVTKLNKNGAIEWKKSINWSIRNNSWDAKSFVGQPTNDGGYIFCSGERARIVKLSGTGTLLWAKDYANYVESDYSKGILFEFGRFYSIIQTLDGGFVAAGSTSNFGEKGEGLAAYEYRTDVYLVKLNTQGDIQWAKTYGNFELYESANCVSETKEGGFIISGYAEQPWAVGFQNYANSGFLLKTNSAGIAEWSKYYGVKAGAEPITGSFNYVTVAADSGYIGIGPYGAVVKTDGMGNIQWSKQYLSDSQNGCEGYASKKIYSAYDGGYILEGSRSYCFDKSLRLPGIMLSKLSTNGSIKWNRAFGSGNELDVYLSTPFIVTKDSGYAFAAHTADTIIDGNYHKYGFNYVVKTDSLGFSNNCQHTKSNDLVRPTDIVLQTHDWIVAEGTAFFSSITSYTVINNPVTSSSTCLNTPITANFISSKLCDSDSACFHNKSNAVYYIWNFGEPNSTENSSTEINPKHKYSSAGTYTVNLTAKDHESIVVVDTAIKITILPSKFITSVSSDVTICQGDSTLLNASGTWTITTSGYFSGWMPKEGLKDPYYTTFKTYTLPSITTKYTASAWNGYCYDYDSLVVTVVSIPSVKITGNTTICEGTSVVLSVAGAETFLWSTSETSTLITVSSNTSTTYSVIGFNGACYDSDSLRITILPSFTVNAGDNVTINQGTEVMLLATSKGTVNWSPPLGLTCITCPDPKVTPAITTTYYASTTEGNCTSVDSITVFVNDCSIEFFVPNAFSPNNDGVNDSLIVSVNDCIRGFILTIYTRWGEKVFESDRIDSYWDGKFKGKQMDNGVFVYYLSVISLKDEFVEKKGNISLVR